MLKNRSGQFVYFSLVSALSGNPVEGASGAISGRKSLDGLSGLIVLSGNVVELGGGSYRANLFSEDTNGDQGGYFFTASGCVPVQYQFDMVDGNCSGRIYSASGQSVAVNSGQTVGVYSGNLSGQLVTVASGAFGTASLNSGQQVNVYSGQLSGQPILPLSGAFTVASLNSGQSVLIYSGQLSGQQVNLLSGNLVSVVSGTRVNTWSGQVFPASGTSPISGDVWLASGHPATLYSGQTVGVYSGNLSGQLVTVNVASGLFVTASLNSGQQVLLYSGQSVNVYSGQLSGQLVTPASGAFTTASLNSGQSVTLYSGVANVLIPDAVLKRAFGSVSGLEINSGQRCLLNANRKLINAWDLVTSGKLTVYREDDATVAYTQNASSVSGAAPVTGLDTN